MKYIEGTITILIGIYAFLLARGILPFKPKHPEKMAMWRKKFGGLLTILAPLVILFGIATLVGVFDRP